MRSGNGWTKRRDAAGNRRRLLGIAALAALALGACGGSGGGRDGNGGSAGAGDGGGGGAGDSDPRGELLQNPPTLVRTVSIADLLGHLDDPVNQALLLQAGSPVCDVSVHKIEYRTVGGTGESTTASGALMVPSGSDPKCHGDRPVVLYAHGTSTDKAFDLTDLGNGENAEGLYLAAFFAAQGFIVVAPNYAGYDTSTLPYHPYLVADQQSKDMIDALAAARSALPVSSAAETRDGGKLFVTGYSQGGYVAMATQRALEAQGNDVTASAPLSGPYALSAFVDAVFFGEVSGGAPVLGTFLITAYQHAYGDVYGTPSEVFEPQFAEGIDALLPSTRPRSALYEEGALPQRAFFSTEPPAPEFADITPPRSPAVFAQLFERGFASADFLVRNDYRLAYLRDAQAHPDGFWPDKTTAAPPDAPQLPFRAVLKRNDLRDWTPRSPTLLCGGHDDPTVFWLNTQAIAAYWAAQSSVAPYTVLDVDAAPSGNDDPYAEIKRRFGIARDVIAASGGNTAVLENYHAGLVAPSCLEAAQEFFEAHMD